MEITGSTQLGGKAGGEGERGRVAERHSGKRRRIKTVVSQAWERDLCQQDWDGVQRQRAG